MIELETEMKMRTTQTSRKSSDSRISSDDETDSDLEEVNEEKKALSKDDQNGDLSSNVSEEIKQQRLK